jgi:hypothetical protein
MEPHPAVFVLGPSSLGGENVLAAELLDPVLLAGLLFGTTTVLQANHQRDIEHLQQHVRTGGDPFVTLDGDFSTQDVSASSRSAFGRFGPKNS